MDYRIVSIGALSHHELWNENGAGRTAHATTVLIQSNSHNILVDPGLPGEVVAARLAERVGLQPSAITDVFLTNFRPAHRWGLGAFEHARCHISEMEREAVGHHLIDQLKHVSDEESKQAIEQDVALLKRCTAAPDRLADQVDLFPLPGFTPGTCGLLLSNMNSTTLIAGDAVATGEHLQQGRVLRGAFDPAVARDSLAEALEIADIIVPGHDNIQINPTRGQF